MQSQRKCATCGRLTLHVRQESVSDGMGCLLVILTGGLFLPVWVLLAAVNAVCQAWRCQVCGGKS